MIVEILLFYYWSCRLMWRTVHWFCAFTLQQFEIIKNLTNLEVEEYYGAKGVDTWNLKSWEKETSDHDVGLPV